jgi:GrpB-like predicted nucleotidyltransferase (UPF0157 family)
LYHRLKAVDDLLQMTEGRPVIIEDYSPRWPLVFDELRAVVAAALGNLAVVIEHVGSTSVPGLCAKPIIDLDVILESRERLPAVIAALGALGYVHQGDLGITGREAFAARDVHVPYALPARNWMDHHLYVCAKDNLNLYRHLKFRDYLRTHPIAASAYGDLKRQLASRFRHDRDAYCESKTEFIQATLAKTERPNEL